MFLTVDMIIHRLAFFKAAYALFDSDFYVKADDDIYLRPGDRIYWSYTPKFCVICWCMCICACWHLFWWGAWVGRALLDFFRFLMVHRIFLFYLFLDRLSLLLAKERPHSQTYLGCMKKGPVFTDPKLKWLV